MTSPISLLPKPARYFPLDKPVYEVAPGLKTWASDLGNGEADQKIFQLDSEFPKYRASKLEARNERLSKYVCETPLLDAVRVRVTRFILERLTHEHPDFFEWKPLGSDGSGHFHCKLTHEHFELGPKMELVSQPQSKTPYASALDAVMSQVQEDLGVVIGTDPSASADSAGPKDRLASLHLCSPSHWAAEDKIGKSFFAIHEPIPGVEKLNRASKAIVDAMIHKGPYVRFVWGFATDHRLNHHPIAPDGFSHQEWHGRSFANDRDPSPFLMRLERQVVWGLPDVDASLFFIRVYFIEGNELRSHPHERDLLVGAIRSMTPESLKYKGLDRCRDEVLAWLEQN